MDQNKQNIDASFNCSPIFYILFCVKICTKYNVILLKKNFEYKIKYTTSDNTGNSLLLHLDLGEISLVNKYICPKYQ